MASVGEAIYLCLSCWQLDWVTDAGWCLGSLEAEAGGTHGRPQHQAMPHPWSDTAAGCFWQAKLKRLW